MVVLGRRRKLSKHHGPSTKRIVIKWKPLLVVALLPIWFLYYSGFAPSSDDTPILLFVGDNPPATALKIIPNGTRKNVNIFYHTFSGPTTEDRNLARKIVAEQMEILGQASRQNEELSWILRYRTVGQNPRALDPVFLKPFCTNYNNLHCEYAGHEIEADEDVTLQQLYEFCLYNPNEVVVYLHSKGSYHDHEINRHWRAPLTSAAVNPSCVETLYNNQSTTCGLQFYPLWVNMYPGNIWSARCSHIQRLLSPLEYRRQLAIVANISQTETAIWKHRLYRPRKDHMGVDRFANEHWITSHPDTKPYDLLGEISTLFPYLSEKDRRETAAKRLEAKAAPRTSLSAGSWIRFDVQRFREVVAQDGKRPHDYFLLPGILFRFYKIYGSFPSRDSWIWDYFPNGREWYEKVSRAQVLAKGDGSLDESIIW